jgi:hypothetical protein
MGGILKETSSTGRILHFECKEVGSIPTVSIKNKVIQINRGDCIMVSTLSSKLKSQGSIPCHSDFIIIL